MKSKRWVRVVFRRRVFVISTLLVQIGFIIALLAGTGIYFRYVNWALNFLSIVVCVHVLNKREKSAYKLTWIFLIMLFPFFGGIMYIIFYSQSNPRKLRRLIEKKSRGGRDLLRLPGDHLANLIGAYPEFGPQAHYLQEYAGFPVYIHTRTEYFDSGESFFQRVLAEMGKAERYIFLEFFILREGVMLNPIISLLERKARQGLDVRVMYDDLGQNDISELQNNPNFSIEASNAVYIIFMIIGIIGYFTIPTVANWIISAGGMGAYNRNINSTAAKAGGVAGAAAGAVSGNITGRLTGK